MFPWLPPWAKTRRRSAAMGLQCLKSRALPVSARPLGRVHSRELQNARDLKGTCSMKNKVYINTSCRELSATVPRYIFCTPKYLRSIPVALAVTPDGWGDPDPTASMPPHSARNSEPPTYAKYHFQIATVSFSNSRISEF